MKIPNPVFFSGRGVVGASHPSRRSGRHHSARKKQNVDRGPSAGPSVRVVVRLKKSGEILVFSNLYSSRTRRLYTRETHTRRGVRRSTARTRRRRRRMVGRAVRRARATLVRETDGRTTKRQRNERTNAFPFGGTQSAWSASSVGTRSSDFNCIPTHSFIRVVSLEARGFLGVVSVHLPRGVVVHSIRRGGGKTHTGTLAWYGIDDELGDRVRDRGGWFRRRGTGIVRVEFNAGGLDGTGGGRRDVRDVVR